MSEAGAAAAQTEADRQSDDDTVLETDPEGRYYRYRELVGKGKFKVCNKAFDSQIGIDVAWSKINAEGHQLNDEELAAVISDIDRGLELDHPNIIKCLKCWRDVDSHCINLITELFTSGNLRQYRNLHKHLDAKAVKRMARQILRGLQHIHKMGITHGDLRCDKIYVNGHSGEIKIGDLGLSTLIPYRWEGVAEEAGPLPLESSSDIFAFGLCILELLTLKQLDPQHCAQWPELVAELQDEEARAFIMKCLGQGPRPSAMELLEDPFLTIKKDPSNQDSIIEGFNRSMMQQSLQEAIAAATHADKQNRQSEDPASSSGQDDIGSGPIVVGKLRGEDYIFEFAGKVKMGKMHFRLVMTQAVHEVTDTNPHFERTIDFVFDPEVDTADMLASEISETFNLSPTDTEICAAALREWLAKEFPGLVESSSK